MFYESIIIIHAVTRISIVIKQRAVFRVAPALVNVNLRYKMILILRSNEISLRKDSLFFRIGNRVLRVQNISKKKRENL